VADSTSGQAAGRTGDATTESSDEGSAPNPDDPFSYGKLPTVKGDANEDVKSVVETIKSGKNPERVSVLMPPKKFDPAAYQRDPQGYLQTVEPGRVFQPKQPGKGVKRIKRASPQFVRIKQNTSTRLCVQALPGAPVSWTSFDCGKFANQLTSITVQADERGLAETEFFGTPGTIEDVHILCASPMTSGQIRYTVHVERPGNGAN
jgi:hypothetical protein